MRIIQATLADVELIVSLFDAYRVFYKQTSDKVLAKTFLTQRLMNKDSIIFVCMEGDHAIGFTQLYPVFSSVSCQADYILNDLFVMEEARGRGAAKLLLLQAQQFAKQQGRKGLALETQQDNPARFLYEKLGWQKSTNLYYYWSV